MSDTDSSPRPVAAAPKQHDGESEKYHAFVNLALALAAITGVELVLVYLPFNQTFIFIVLLSLSLFKFVSVIAWFMHLLYDKLLLTLAFGAGMTTAVGVFVALGFLMSPGDVDMEAITGF